MPAVGHGRVDFIPLLFFHLHLRNRLFVSINVPLRVFLYLNVLIMVKHGIAAERGIFAEVGNQNHRLRGLCRVYILFLSHNVEEVEYLLTRSAMVVFFANEAY